MQTSNNITGIFIVPFLQLIFGLELTIRGLRTKPFPKRGKWTVAICFAVWTTLLLVMGLVTFFVPSADFCFASLFWFVAKWAVGGFALFTLMSVVLIGCAIIIFVKLTRHSTIETSERVEASRMVYFLSVAILSDVCSPFTSLTRKGSTLTIHRFWWCPSSSISPLAISVTAKVPADSHCL